MALDIDSLALDRVFQPASDRLTELTSCFGLARLALVGAVALQIAVLAADLQAEDNVVLRLFAVGITVLALVGAHQARHVISRTERRTRPGLMNINRITLRWQRVAWLVIVAWSISAAAGNLNATNAAVCGASVAWLSCVYFLSCSPRPPMVRNTRGVFAFAR